MIRVYMTFLRVNVVDVNMLGIYYSMICILGIVNYSPQVLETIPTGNRASQDIFATPI